jgi:hypothetical protein
MVMKNGHRLISTKTLAHYLDTERVDERKREFVWERERDRERNQAKKSERERKIL